MISLLRASRSQTVYAHHTAFFVPPPFLTPTSSAVVAGPASSLDDVHPFVLVQSHPWPCPVCNHRWSCSASHLCCSHSALIAHHVPLSHLVPYTSTGLILPRRWSLLPPRAPPITAVSQEAVDGTSKQSELLSLMFSLSSAAQIAPYSVEFVEFWVIHIWTVSLLCPLNTCSDTQDLSLTGMHNLNYFYCNLFCLLLFWVSFSRSVQNLALKIT